MLRYEQNPTQDFYLGSGKWLIDKDRNINSDLVEIHDFFEPIDRLLGDYETRKKLNLQEYLYRRNFVGKEIAISKDVFEEKRKQEGDNYQLLLFSIGHFNNEYCINVEWISVKNLVERKLPLQDNCLAHYILDPVKLYQIIQLDEARFNYFCNEFWQKNSELVNGQNINDLNKFIEDYAFVKNFFKRHNRFFVMPSSPKMKIDDLREINKNDNTTKEYLDKKADSIEAIYEKIDYLKNIEKIPNAQEIVDALENEKLKRFERFNEVRIRLGVYKNNRPVIFLHPYENESNNPGRIPAEE